MNEYEQSCTTEQAFDDGLAEAREKGADAVLDFLDARLLFEIGYNSEAKYVGAHYSFTCAETQAKFLTEVLAEMRRLRGKDVHVILPSPSSPTQH